MVRPLSHNGFVENQIKVGDPRETYAGLLWIAQNRGFKSGWVAHKFKEIFGKWPKPTTPVVPSAPESRLVEYLGITNKRWRAKKKREEAKNGAAIISAFKDYQPFPFTGEGLETD